MALEGSIKDFGIAEIFQLINLQKKSGILNIQNSELTASASIMFVAGEITYAFSSTSGDDEKIGRLLINAGKLSEEALEEILHLQETSGDKIGHLIVVSGYITKEDLKEVLQVQIKDTIFQVFRWKNGCYKFEAQPIEYEKEYQIPIPTDFILMEGIRMLDEWPYIENLIPSGNIIYTQNYKGEETETIFSSLTQEELSVFNLIDGQRDVNSIIQLVNLTEFEVYKSFATLKVADIISETSISQEAPVHSTETTGPIEPTEPTEQEEQFKDLPEKRRAWTAIQIAILTFIVSFVFLLFPIGEIGGIKYIISTLNTLKKISTEEELSYLRTAIKYYQIKNQDMPTSLEMLYKENFVKADTINDSWGNQYVFDLLPQGYRLYSKGPDGILRTIDDLK